MVQSLRNSPHLVVLQQVRVDKYPQLSAVTEQRNATTDIGNPTGKPVRGDDD